MRSFLQVIFCLILFTTAKAQEIMLKGGFAIPSGNYSNSTLAKSDNSFATSGSCMAIRLNYPWIKRSGIYAEAGVAGQGFNAGTFAEQLSLNNPSATISISNVSGFKSSYTLLGAFIHFPKGNFSFKVDAAVGLMSLRTPSYLIGYNYGSNTGNDYISSKSAQAFLFNWGLDASYALPRHMTLHAFLQNMNATFTMPSTNYTSSTQPTYDLKFEVYQIGMGLGYSF